MTRGRAPCLAAFALALGPLPAAAQMPTVRIEFRLQAREYIQAFADTARRRLEDSATAMLVRAFRSNVAFLQFTASDSTPRVLRITLDQRDRSDSTDLREFGLRVVLEDPPMRSEPLYWKTLRRSSNLGAPITPVENFLAAFDAKLDDLDDAAWARLVKASLGKISIGDSTTVAVWQSPNGFLIPYRPEELCIDRKTGKIRVEDDERKGGVTESGEVIASTKGLFTPDSTQVPAAVFSRYNRRIHAKPIDGSNLPPADSVRITGVYMEEYHFDATRCFSRVAPVEEPNP